MKKFLALVMAAVLLCSTFSFTFAETTSCDNGHKLKELTQTEIEGLESYVAATCTTPGSYDQVCDECGSTVHHTIDALGHINETAKPAHTHGGKCGDKVYEHFTTCTRCGLEIKDACAVCAANGCEATGFCVYVKTIEHDFSVATNDVVVKPTCTEKGYTRHYCDRNDCTYFYDDTYVDALGHTWVVAELEKDIDPSCYAIGAAGQYIYCDVCKVHYAGTFVDENENKQWDDGELKVDAAYIPMLDHDVETVTEWEKTKGVNFSKDFEDMFFAKAYNPDNADEFKYEESYWVWNNLEDGVTVINAKENPEYAIWPFTHSGVVTVDYKAKTCTEDGHLSVKCSCGYERSIELIADGHDYDVAKITFVDRSGKSRRFDVKFSDYLAWELIDNAAVIEGVADFLDINLTVEKLLNYLYHAEYITQEYVMKDCTIAPIVEFECSYCGAEIDAKADACDNHFFGTEKDIEKYLEKALIMLASDAPEADMEISLPIGKILKIEQKQIPEYNGNDEGDPDKGDNAYDYEERDQKTVVITFKDNGNKNHIADNRDAFIKFQNKIAKCTEYKVTVRCIHCDVNHTFTINEDAKHFMKDETHWFTVREATCTTPGLRIKNCADKNCGYTEAENIKPIDHVIDETKTVIVPANCVDNGTRTVFCKYCDYTATEEIPSFGHKYDWYYPADKAPTCTKTGIKEWKCERCGLVDHEVVLEQSHVIPDEWVENIRAIDNMKMEDLQKALVAAGPVYEKDGTTVKGWKVPSSVDLPWTDCEKDGNFEFTCINCKHVTINHKAADHTWKKAEKDGKNWIDDTWTDEKTGKDMGKPYFVDDNTCRDEDLQHYICTVCGTTKTEIVTTDSKHIWNGDDSTVYIPTTSAPTCIENGYGFHVCVNCEKHFVKEIKAFGHDFKTVFDTEKNDWTYVCKYCGYVESPEYAAEKYVIDTDSIVWANRTTGTGYALLDDGIKDAFVFGQRYAYIQWTWVTKAGDNVVADTVVELKSEGKGVYSFSAKGVSVAGATLDNVVIYITDDADAVDFSSTNYGATRMD